MSTHTTYVELEIEVEYTFSKGMKGHRDRFGVPEEPDDDDEFEITAIEATNKTWQVVDITDFLTKAQLDTIEREVWEKLAEDEP